MEERMAAVFLVSLFSLLVGVLVRRRMEFIGWPELLLVIMAVPLLVASIYVLVMPCK